MVEKYTGNDRRYAGEEVDVTYNLKRCIHAAYCVSRLSEVFDTNKRPWINVGDTSADRVSAVVEMCPSGALHYDRKDGIKEPIPEKNTITLRKDGPLEIRGNLTIQGATVDLEQETRVTLCRCGASKNKPFCDNTHKDIDFKADSTPPVVKDTGNADGQLVITSGENGPLHIKGAFEMLNEAGEVVAAGDETWLCRCGGSGNKPYCDGTHKRIDFVAE